MSNVFIIYPGTGFNIARQFFMKASHVILYIVSFQRRRSRTLRDLYIFCSDYYNTSSYNMYSFKFDFHTHHAREMNIFYWIESAFVNRARVCRQKKSRVLYYNIICLYAHRPLDDRTLSGTPTRAFEVSVIAPETRATRV